MDTSSIAMLLLLIIETSPGFSHLLASWRKHGANAKSKQGSAHSLLSCRPCIRGSNHICESCSLDRASLAREDVPPDLKNRAAQLCARGAEGGQVARGVLQDSLAKPQRIKVAVGSEPATKVTLVSLTGRWHLLLSRKNFCGINTARSKAVATLAQYQRVDQHWLYH
eukprot:354079-Pelagomonas_calceolata.AAC.3